MPEWWVTVFPAAQEHAAAHILGRLMAAFVLGLCVAAVYHWTASPRNRTPSFVPTLVLLCILIAMVTQVVGESAARAFSLVGTLSIVRFRTAVRDTRDTAFVIFAVIVGMAAGSGHLLVSLIGLPIVAAAARLLRSVDGAPTARHPWTLALRVATTTSTATVAEALPRWFEKSHLTAIATGKQGSVLDLKYDCVPKRDVTAADCIAGLTALEGVQSVDLTRQ